jgi:hypothetical protein
LDVAISRRRLSALTNWQKLAGTAWLVVLLVICVRTFIFPNDKTVYPTWSSTSRLWWSEGELYKPWRPLSVQGGFRYSPLFPILATPFAMLPDALGGVLWRCACTALYAAAVCWWLRAVVPAHLTRDQVALLFLLLLPLSIQSLSNGQANVLVIAALLASVAAIKEGRWTWASVFIALAFACKLYPLALGLLLVVLYPRQLGWRVVLALLAVLVAPFLTQSPAYVLDQYHKWALALRADDRSAIVWDQMYRDLWLLVRAVNVPLPRPAYEVFQVLSGAAVALVCWRRQRLGWPDNHLLTNTLALAAVWMLLLGPATESCTFILLAPSLAWSFVEVMREPGWRWRRSLLFACGGLFLSAVVLGAFPQALQVHSLGLHPLATLLYLVYLLTEPQPRRAGAAASKPGTLLAA